MNIRISQLVSLIMQPTNVNLFMKIMTIDFSWFYFQMLYLSDFDFSFIFNPLILRFFTHDSKILTILKDFWYAKWNERKARHAP